MTGSAVTERDVQRDTGCLVYAVVRRGERDILPSDGIDNEPLRLVAHGSVAAVVNEIALERPPGRRALRGTSTITPTTWGARAARAPD